MKLRTLAALLGTGAAAGAAYARFARPWHLRWGATKEEIEGYLPGDEFAEGRDLDATHAITIDAPPDCVWPWIAQIGQNKAGCYSYQWLENLAGCEMPDIREIVPAWQGVTPGDEVWLHPHAPPLKVLRMIPGSDLVLESVWSFHVRPIDGGDRSRLIVRGRGKYNPDFGRLLNFAYWRLVFEPAHFIMERKMLFRIKELAEELAAEREARVLVGVA